MEFDICHVDLSNERTKLTVHFPCPENWDIVPYEKVGSPHVCHACSKNTIQLFDIFIYPFDVYKDKFYPFLEEMFIQNNLEINKDIRTNYLNQDGLFI